MSRRRSAFVVVLGGAVAAALGACSLLTDLGGFTGGSSDGSDGAPGDGSPGAPGDGGADADGQSPPTECVNCVPSPIATGLGYVQCFTIDDTRVYWQSSTKSGLFQANKVDGTDQAKIAPYADGYDLVADSSSLYWVSGHDLWQLPKGSDQRVSLTQVATGIGQFQLDPPHIFFSEYDADGGVFGMLGDGGSVTSIAPNKPYARTIAVDSTALYFVSDGQVWRVAKGGGPASTPIALSARVGNPTDVLIDQANVYWTDIGVGDYLQYLDAGVAKSVRAGVGSRIDLATSQQNISSFALDGSYVYWTTLGESVDGGFPNGAVHKVPIGGGAEVILAKDQNYPVQLVVDDAAVYWLEQGPGTIWRLAKYGP